MYLPDCSEQSGRFIHFDLLPDIARHMLCQVIMKGGLERGGFYSILRDPILCTKFAMD